jgi:UDP:flavonoid glycosyltransferase YjiC (YdhE family)
MLLEQDAYQLDRVAVKRLNKKEYAVNYLNSLNVRRRSEDGAGHTQFRHTGRFHDGNGRIELDFPWERLTGEPLIYASMGTEQSGLADVFRVIATAGMKRKDFQLVLSVSHYLDLKEIGPLPSDTIIVKRAPQMELLNRASVCITHAGMSTVLEALAQCVRQVAMPVANDQPGVVARIPNKKTGLFVPLKDLTPSHLSLLLDKVLNDSAYRLILLTGVGARKL